MANFLTKLLTMGEGKQLRVFENRLDGINALEPEMQALSDTQLAAKTVEFRQRLEDGETLDDLLPEAFAVTREASVRSARHAPLRRAAHRRHGAQRRQIAEMKTGEGKTLVSTLAGYLNALPGEGVHVVTVNDYLAKRDSEWMGRIYRFLGMEVGMIQSQMDPFERIPAYAADVTYGTNAEFGFDYLRDNMVVRPEERVQRGHHFAIVDEVDSILIDEARTPLIISGAGTKSADTYKQFAKVIPRLRPDDRLRARRGQAHHRGHRGGPAQARAGCSASTTSTPTRRASWSTTCSSRSRPSSCSSATSTTWSKTARS